MNKQTINRRLATMLAVLAIVLALVSGVPAKLLSAPDASAQVVASNGKYVPLSWLSSTALTATGQTAAATNLGGFHLIAMQISCTAVTGSSPSLTLKMQGSVDQGATWQDLQTFTAITATGNAIKYYADVNASTAQMIPDQVRAQYTITGSSPSLTCAITGAAKS